jgi:hypothetical protein
MVCFVSVICYEDQVTKNGRNKVKKYRVFWIVKQVNFTHIYSNLSFFLSNKNLNTPGEYIQPTTNESFFSLRFIQLSFDSKLVFRAHLFILFLE